MAETDLHRPRPFCDWHEDRGDVLWWRIPISEPPYLGTPLDLGRSMKVEVTIGLEHHEMKGADVGGWPWQEEDERHLWWTPLPDAKRIEDQVPL